MWRRASIGVGNICGRFPETSWKLRRWRGEDPLRATDNVARVAPPIPFRWHRRVTWNFHMTMSPMTFPSQQLLYVTTSRENADQNTSARIHQADVAEKASMGGIWHVTTRFQATQITAGSIRYENIAISARTRILTSEYSPILF